MVDILQLRVLQHFAIRADRLPHDDHGEDIVAVVFVGTATIQLRGDQPVLGLHEPCHSGPLVEKRLLDVRRREDECVDERERRVGVVGFQLALRRDQRAWQALLRRCFGHFLPSRIYGPEVEWNQSIDPPISSHPFETSR